MINADILKFQEFAMRETFPLLQIQKAILEFSQRRKYVVLFGTQAVNAYVSEPRLTQNVGLLSDRADELAGDLSESLSEKFYIAVRVREVVGGKSSRIH